MRLHRFYVLQPLGEEVVIDDVSQIFQWTKVFRYQTGDFVILFNGDGYDHCYSIVEIAKKTCSLKRTEQTPNYIPTQKITLCLSLIKKDNFELAVQKATELGVETILPVISSRSEKKNLSEERLVKIAAEASEQCFRGDVPHILPISSLEEAIISLEKTHTLITLSMGGTSLLTEKANLVDKNVALFIGPEGGWSEEDLMLLEKKSIQCSLGKTVLRAETAAIVAVAFVGSD
jgi:16S rRNA (uracil1498-N3)-methyltransferase